MSVLPCPLWPWYKSTKRNSGADKSIFNIAFINFKRVYIFFSVRINNWFSRISFPALQGWSFVKQRIGITSDPSVARFKAHALKDRFKELALKDFLIISGVISFYASRIHITTVKLEILKKNQPSKLNA